MIAGPPVGDLRGDDALVDASFGQLVNAPYFGATWTNGNSWLTFAVWTVPLAKARTLLVTDGQVTVSSWTGPTRMAAADRFFVFTLNLTSAWWPLVPGVNTILVPRSIFLDTMLKADFDAGDYGYLPNAAVYGDDLAKASMPDGVAAVIAEGRCWDLEEVQKWERGAAGAPRVLAPTGRYRATCTLPRRG